MGSRPRRLMRAINPRLIVAAMGVSALLLPSLLLFGTLCGQPLQPSISAYYYADSPWDDVFIGTMCAIGICLFAYRGFDGEMDNRLAYVASALAFIVAAFPPRIIEDGKVTDMVPVNYVHLIAAVLFICILGFFCVRFANKKSRSKSRPAVFLHMICFTVLVLGLATSIVGWFIAKNSCPIIPIVFWGETAVVVAFGISWLAKAKE